MVGQRSDDVEVDARVLHAAEQGLGGLVEPIVLGLR